MSEKEREREGEREQKKGEWQVEGEAGSPLSKGPDAGLKADASPTEPPRRPCFSRLLWLFRVFYGSIKILTVCSSSMKNAVVIW